MNGWLVYSQEESVRNEWFAGRLIESASEYRLQLDLMIEEEMAELPVLPDFVIYRGRDHSFSRRLEEAGVRLFNRSEVTRIANDKLQTAQLAMLLGIPVVPTRELQRPAEIRTFPAVVKTVSGHGGKDVFLCETMADVEQLLAERPDDLWIFQPFIEHGASDVRVYMLGEECTGAVRRTGADSFKSNVALGGHAERFSPPAPLLAFAEKIVKAVKSDYIGIDFIQNEEGVWLLNEIEDPVGARSLYETSDCDAARELMRYIDRKLKKPF
ncbi:alpha-L-glutamate ligase [Sporosarcina sp. NCCP-2716]|uniref:ATP-grasp domain-containing protein n=1 Tax=Sporosarcina sp. NCCP-2716 TaxID=2943679 RepID=UPI00203DC2DE|nr:alpha-L-glutamate ligase [Sporosarcina sp. NCCP-2716]GKV68803.1 alpha-L-glutamate ligase [Sporosarcina sp. NCCP-2716]